MAVRGIPAPESYFPLAYWEDRARRFAAEGDGLAAVCSYGMPAFYNRLIHLSQWLALRRWLRVPADSRVLDVGCGVGRWSLMLAGQGASVTGIDLSPTMISQAQRRAAQRHLGARCQFLVQDLAHLEAGAKFDLILGVTVLQHILDPAALRSAVQRIAEHLAPGGRVVLLEAAPARPASHCDTSVFRARERSAYVKLFEECGLELTALSGVDPTPFKTWLLPHMRRLPRWLSLTALLAVTVLSAPIDAVFGRCAVRHSWHAVFVLRHARRSSSCA